jgi:hypothetical protein
MLHEFIKAWKFTVVIFITMFAFYSFIDLVLLDGKIQVVFNCIGAGLGAFFATHWYIRS